MLKSPVAAGAGPNVNGPSAKMPANRHAHELCVVHDPIRSNYAP